MSATGVVRRRGNHLNETNVESGGDNVQVGEGDESQELRVDDLGFTQVDLLHRALPATVKNVPDEALRLTLMEELILLGLKDTQGYLSFWNDSISYALRGLILMELSMRGLIKVYKEPSGRHLRRDYCDRLIDLSEVKSDKGTGDVLLDETLKLIKMELVENNNNRYSISQWIDLLSGETWNLLKFSYQLKQVRERLAKQLVDKGVLSTSKKNFLLFEMATHPLNESSVVVKEEIVIRVRNLLLGRGAASGGQSRRSIALCCASYAASVLENALMYDVSPQTWQLLNNQQSLLPGADSPLATSLTYGQKDSCFARCEELMEEYSGQKAQSTGNSQKRSSLHDVAQLPQHLEKIGWTDIMAGVVQVFMRMDSVL
ncbi:hypothetical protein MIR68_001908 [Amoeboaphelidium protococcarum]|nr:hypothetical protein MIR68_001908 [Amoeboaphelidium protococcarum]